MKRLLVLGFLCISLVLSPTIFATDQVILVLWHGLEALPGGQFDVPVALGFLNTRGGGGEPLSASYLSIGAGARAVGATGIAAFFQDEIGGSDLYRRHTGLEPATLVQPKIAQIQAAQNVSYRLELGALGNAFAEAGVPLRILGNSDTLEVYSWAALVGMDGWGRVWLGSVGSEFTMPDPEYPYGLRTDYAQLQDEVLQAGEPLVIVDLGDPFRYDQYQNQFVPSQRKLVQDLVVKEAELFLENIVKNTSPETVVLVISPYPSQALAGRGFWLTPVVCWGLREGLLTSGTTRWPGLITNMDIAPTVLELLGVEHTQPFVGRSAIVDPLPQAEAVIWLESMATKIELLSRYRGLVLRAFVIAQILTYTAVLIFLIVSSEPPQWVMRILQLALVVLMVLPLCLLLWNRTPWLAVALVVAICVLKLRGTPSVALIGLISLGTALLIALDVVSGSWLMRYSFLGYDPIGGARFYGLGNEFMGVLIGSAIMAWAALAQTGRVSKRWINVWGLVFFAVITAVIGAPSLGTNVGGAISAVIGFGSTWMAFSGQKASVRKALVLALATFAVLGTLMLVDGGNAQGEQSHIGQTVELLGRDGLIAIALIIKRKVSMNLKLLRYSMWSNALIVAMVGMGASFIWPSKYIQWLRKNHPLISKAILGVVFGSTAAFIFNDSGVVAAATCLTFASSTLLLLALELKHNFGTSQSYIEDNGYRN